VAPQLKTTTAKKIKKLTYMKYRILSLILITGLLACDKNNNVSLFSIENDKELGQQVSQEIENDSQYPVMERAQYPAAYAYLDSMTQALLASDAVAYRSEFAWEVHLVQDDQTLNAFATPAGYIYVYTGLIQYLDSAAALAGVMAHEIAHADLRHSSRNLQRQYGVSMLLSLLVGENPSTLENIAAQLAGNLSGLSFSREFETEADEKSVEYLADTDWGCQGAKLFFEKLEAAGQGSQLPQFLSTHPSPDNRIENIEDKVAQEGCDTTLQPSTRYQQFQAALP
jgi:predicted Zn-dependent protease